MNTVESLTYICQSFKEKKYGLEEFQSRLETLMISDELKLYLEKPMNDAINRLEEVRFCSQESNFYRYGVEVAEILLETIKNIK
jgi:division protein CdvB (Snf7/Vps24/ESCRT-III family)